MTTLQDVRDVATLDHIISQLIEQHDFDREHDCDAICALNSEARLIHAAVLDLIDLADGELISHCETVREFIDELIARATNAGLAPLKSARKLLIRASYCLHNLCTYWLTFDCEHWN